MSFVAVLVLYLNLTIPTFTRGARKFTGRCPHIVSGTRLLSTSRERLLADGLSRVDAQRGMSIAIIAASALSKLAMSSCTRQFCRSRGCNCKPSGSKAVLLVDVRSRS